jgi:hypothetical protein
MGIAPRFQLLPGGGQGLATGRERILNTRRHLCKDSAGNQPLLLQFSQLQREHAVGDVRQDSFQLAEAARLWLQLMQNKQLPATTHEVESIVDTAEVAEDVAVAAVSGGELVGSHYFLFCVYLTMGSQLVERVGTKVVLPHSMPIF